MSPRKISILRSKSKDKIGFSSNVKRFESTLDISKDKMSPMRGPGFYEIQD